MDRRIELGDRVRDRISGFEGIVIGITDWLYQCRRPIVQPTTMNDGKPTGTESFDEPQLEVIERAAFAPMVQESAPPVDEKTGGPRDTPSRRPEPRRR